MDRRAAVDEAARSLRRVLDLVDAAELEASAAFVAQVRGAISALEAVDRLG